MRRRVPGWALVVTLALAACEETAPVPATDAGPDTRYQHQNPCNRWNKQCKKCPGFVTPSGWCWHTPLPQGSMLSDVWCSGATDVVVAGGQRHGAPWAQGRLAQPGHAL